MEIIRIIELIIIVIELRIKSRLKILIINEEISQILLDVNLGSRKRKCLTSC